MNIRLLSNEFRLKTVSNFGRLRDRVEIGIFLNNCIKAKIVVKRAGLLQHSRKLGLHPKYPICSIFLGEPSQPSFAISLYSSLSFIFLSIDLLDLVIVQRERERDSENKYFLKGFSKGTFHLYLISSNNVKELRRMSYKFFKSRFDRTTAFYATRQLQCRFPVYWICMM